MPVEQPTKAFAVYHWDTFDPPGDNTTLIHQADTFEQAEAWVKRIYGDRITPHGADRVQIVNKGRVWKNYAVG